MTEEWDRQRDIAAEGQRAAIYHSRPAAPDPRDAEVARLRRILERSTTDFMVLSGKNDRLREALRGLLETDYATPDEARRARGVLASHVQAAWDALSQ